MAGKIVSTITQTVTGISGGACTVASSTGFYKNAFAYLAKSGQPGMTVKIVDVGSGTIRVRQIVDPMGGGVGMVPLEVQANTNFGFTDPTAYSGGTITMPEQLVYNSNDKPLD